MKSENKDNRCLEVVITELEAALLKKLRAIEYGQFTIIVHKIKGNPIRIEVSPNTSEVLDPKEGLNLEGSVYIDNLVRE